MYKKLVRDKIPEIIKGNNQNPITRILSDEEYKFELGIEGAAYVMLVPS